MIFECIMFGLVLGCVIVVIIELLEWHDERAAKARRGAPYVTFAPDNELPYSITYVNFPANPEDGDIYLYKSNMYTYVGGYSKVWILK